MADLASRGGARVRATVAGLLAALIATLLALAASSGGTDPAAASTSTSPVLGTAEPGFLSSDPQRRTKLLDETVEAGAGVVRFNAFWYRIAPTEPTDPRDPNDAAYDFEILDEAVRAADQRGLDIYMTLQRAPAWATGPNEPPQGEHKDRGSWDPDVDAFGDYVHAVTTRYRGDFDPDGGGPEDVLPRVDQHQTWNECNLAKFLAPQFNNQGKPVAVDLCRDLVNEGYSELKAVDPTLEAIFPGTSPVGPTNDETRIEPEEFLRLAFCLNKKLKPVGGSKCGGTYSFDIYDHHPIAVKQAPSKPGKQGNVLIADYDKVGKIVRAAEKHDTVAPTGAPTEPRPLWASEMYWETDPPETKRGFPEKKVAAFVAEGIYLLAQHDVETILNFFMIDAELTKPGDVSNIQGGLLYPNYKRKLSFDAFRFPLVGNSKGKKKVRVWGMAPADGQVRIQVPKGKKGWKTAATLTGTEGQAFERTIKLKKPKNKKQRKKKYRVRATAGSIKSVPFAVK